MDPPTPPEAGRHTAPGKIFQITVVGSRFIGMESKQLLECDTMKLVPDPENEYDKNAIAVLRDDKRVGWVSRNTQKEVPALPKEGESFQVVSSYMETRNAITINLN